MIYSYRIIHSIFNNHQRATRITLWEKYIFYIHAYEEFGEFQILNMYVHTKYIFIICVLWIRTHRSVTSVFGTQICCAGLIFNFGSLAEHSFGVSIVVHADLRNSGKCLRPENRYWRFCRLVHSILQLWFNIHIHINGISSRSLVRPYPATRHFL